MTTWCDHDGLRIWRSPRSDFYGDECLHAATVYTDEELAAIAGEGFNAVWMRGRLYELIEGVGWPQLHRPRVAERLASLRAVIERGSRCGVAVYLFFNEPLALRTDDPLWQAHPELAGEPYEDTFEHQSLRSLCVSHPAVRDFFAEAVRQLMGHLPGLGGVILITASEHHSHCWSHYARHGLDDGIVFPATEPLQCPRCRDREPAEIVADLVGCWHDAAQAVRPVPRVICWNWSWSIWYPDPQRQVIDRLPQGVELQLDFDRGGTAQRRGRTMVIDEYSLSVVGPSDRFLASRRVAAERGMPVVVKLQIGTSHELATVPNLPLIPSLHGKFTRMREHGVSGIMGCWNFGCSRTLNTAAMRLYLADPDRYQDAGLFMRDLAADYFALPDPAEMIAAWRRFTEAFDHYPFSIRFLYFAPINYAPAFPLVERSQGKAVGPAWLAHEWGDQLDNCLTPGMTMVETAEAFEAAADLWDEGLNRMHEAMTQDRPATARLADRRQRELRTAQMIGLHLRSTGHIFRFTAWRDGCARLPDRRPAGIDRLLRDELGIVERAAELIAADEELGFHQECLSRMVNPEKLAEKRRQLVRMLEAPAASRQETGGGRQESETV